jgi:hypothetical protein
LKPIFTEPLAELLSIWTATQSRIYQNHGIPQGPISSGLLSEAVLSAFDNAKKIRGVEMFRYVDDIKLFAEDEVDVRREITRLDMKSKDIGLFPQPSKVEIHKVDDIDNELKQISSPIETVVTRTNIDQQGIRRRLRELSPRDRISNPTRFKFLLGCAAPHSELNAKLLRIAKSRPDMVPNIMWYFRRYRSLPDSVSKALLAWLAEAILYPATTNEIVLTMYGRIHGPRKRAFLDRAARFWKPQTMDAMLMASVGSALIAEGELSPPRVEYAVLNAREWWVRCKLIEALNRRHYAEVKLEGLCNTCIRDLQGEVSLAAAYRMIELNLDVTANPKPIHGIAHGALALFGKAKGRPKAICGVEIALHEFIGKATRVDWRKIFGTHHTNAERQALLAFPNAKVTASALVNGADVFDDWLVHALYSLTPALGTYKFGNLTQVAKKTSPLYKVFPSTHALVSAVHEWRYASPYSHPQEQKTKMPTKPLPFRVIGKVRRLYLASFQELGKTWPAT